MNCTNVTNIHQYTPFVDLFWHYDKNNLCRLANKVKIIFKVYWKIKFSLEIKLYKYKIKHQKYYFFNIIEEPKFLLFSPTSTTQKSIGEQPRNPILLVLPPLSTLKAFKKWVHFQSQKLVLEGGQNQTRQRLGWLTDMEDYHWLGHCFW